MSVFPELELWLNRVWPTSHHIWQKNHLFGRLKAEEKHYLEIGIWELSINWLKSSVWVNFRAKVGRKWEPRWFRSETLLKFAPPPLRPLSHILKTSSPVLWNWCLILKVFLIDINMSKNVPIDIDIFKNGHFDIDILRIVLINIDIDTKTATKNADLSHLIHLISVE